MKKKRLNNILFSLILGFIPLIASPQTDLVDMHYHQFDVDDHKTSYRQYVSTSNEAAQIFSALFLLYKEFVSSQDVDACVFTPSCSVYAMESVKTQGLFIGICSAFDRLTRCHAFGGDYYPVHSHTHKYYDPVEKKD